MCAPTRASLTAPCLPARPLVSLRERSPLHTRPGHTHDMHACTSVCIYLYLHAHVYIYIYIYTHKYILIYMYVYALPELFPPTRPRIALPLVFLSHFLLMFVLFPPIVDLFSLAGLSPFFPFCSLPSPPGCRQCRRAGSTPMCRLGPRLPEPGNMYVYVCVCVRAGWDAPAPAAPPCLQPAACLPKRL